MSKKNLLKVNCGDWHLGWGLGSYNHIGKLELNPLTNSFTWRGYSQGRHGSIWNREAYINFTVLDDVITKTGSKGSYPCDSELLIAANEILKNQMTK